MPLETRMRTLRPVPVLAALGAVLTGCGLPPSDGYYGGGSGYYGSPGYYRSHRSSEHHRSRAETSTQQQRLQQHWQNQAQRPR